MRHRPLGVVVALACLLAPNIVSAQARGKAFISVTARRVGGQVRLSVHLQRTPRRLEVSLNGRRLDRLFTGVGTRTRTAAVGADDGLRFGHNAVRILAAPLGGAPRAQLVRFTIPRDRPIAGAGALRRTVPGVSVALDGRSTLALLPVRRLTYRWRLVRRPPGSRARLSRARTAHPRLRPDRPGRYLARLTVYERTHRHVRRVSADQVEVDATAPLPVSGAQVVVDSAHGTGDSVTVAGQRYSFGGSAAAVLLIVYDRATLAFVSQEGFPNSPQGGALASQAAKGLGNGVIAILVSDTGPGSFLDPSFASAFAVVGVAPKPGRQCVTCTAIGVPGAFDAVYFNPIDAPAGAGSPQTANTHGYLQLDPSGTAFTFVPGQFTTFDTSVNPNGQGPSQPGNVNTMQVGTQAFASSALTGCGQGGFQVVILSGRTLALKSNTTVTTNGCNAGNDSAGFVAVATALQTRGPHDLLLLQGIGSPVNPGDGFGLIALVLVARDLQQIGGTYGRVALNQGLSSGPGYAFVSNGSQQAEVAGDAPGHPPARLTGLLQRNRGDYAWAPLGGPGSAFATAQNAPSSAVAQIAYQSPVTWPGAGNAKYLGALRWLAGYIGITSYDQTSSCYYPAGGIPDVRSSYCSSAVDGQSTRIANAPFPANQSAFDQPTFTAVQNELVNVELPYVARVKAVITALETPLVNTEGLASAPITGVANAINAAFSQSVQNSDAMGSTFEWSGLLSALAGFGWAIIPGAGGQVAGLISEVFALTGSLATGPDGTPELSPALSGTTVSEYEQQIDGRYTAAINGLSELGDFILSDYGRLAAFYTSGVQGSNAPSTAAATTSLQLAAAQQSWENLLPVAYQADILNTTAHNTSSDPTQYRCDYLPPGNNVPPIFSYAPFSSVSAAGQYQYHPPTSSYGNLNPVVLAGPGDPTDTGNLPHQEITPTVPPQSLIGPLFQAVPTGYSGASTSNNGQSAAQLGVDPRDFYENVAIPTQSLSVTCDP